LANNRLEWTRKEKTSGPNNRLHASCPNANTPRVHRGETTSTGRRRDAASARTLVAETLATNRERKRGSLCRRRVRSRVRQEETGMRKHEGQHREKCLVARRRHFRSPRRTGARVRSTIPSECQLRR